MVGYNFSRISILIVDDNKYMRSLVITILNALGIRRIQEATDGAGAFAVLKYFPADIVICDLMMDPLDGIQFSQMLRNAKDSPNPMLPIIMMTGHTEMHHIIEAQNAGVNEILAKPISTKAVYERMVEIIENPRPFVRTKSYFGPERRGQDGLVYRGCERRKFTEKVPVNAFADATDKVLDRLGI